MRGIFKEVVGVEPDYFHPPTAHKKAPHVVWVEQGQRSHT